MLRFVAIITIALLCSQVFAQKKGGGGDSLAVTRLCETAEKLRYSNAPEAARAAKQAFYMAVRNKSAWLQQNCLLTLLACISDDGDNNAFIFFEKKFDSLDAVLPVVPFELRRQKIAILYNITQAKYGDVIKMIEPALALARQNGLSDTGELYFDMGATQIRQFNFAGAKKSLYTALAAAGNDDGMLAANTKLQLAFVLSIFKDAKTAGVYYNEALGYYKAGGIITGMAEAYTLMGITALTEYNFDLAASCYLTAAEYYKKADKELGVALSLCQGGIALYSARKSDSAFLFFKQSFTVFKKLDYAPGLAASSSFLSILYRQHDSAALAASYLALAKAVNKKLDVPVFEAITSLEETKQDSSGNNIAEAQKIVAANFGILKKATPGFLKENLNNQLKFNYAKDSASAKAKFYADSEARKQERVALQNSEMLIAASTKFKTTELKDSLGIQAALISQRNKRIANNSRLITMLTLAIAAVALCCLVLYRRLKERAEETEAMKLFAAQLRHENNNGIALVINVLSKSLKEKGFSNLDAELKLRLKTIADMQADYITPDEKGIVFNKYVKDLVEEIDAAFNRGKQINYEISMPEKMKAKNALKLAVLIRELTLNSLKHAFNETGKGNIFMALTPVKKGYARFEFKDNGAGIKTGQGVRTSFGSSIINTISSQLGGKPVVDGNNGYTFVLSFPK